MMVTDVSEYAIQPLLNILVEIIAQDVIYSFVCLGGIPLLLFPFLSKDDNIDII